MKLKLLSRRESVGLAGVRHLLLSSGHHLAPRVTGNPFDVAVVVNPEADLRYLCTAFTEVPGDTPAIAIVDDAGSDGIARSLFSLGYSGILAPPVSANLLNAAISAAARGQIVFGTYEVIDAAIHDPPPVPPSDRLGGSDIRLLRYLAQDGSTLEAAGLELGYSTREVSRRLRNIGQALGSPHRMGTIVRATELGYLTSESWREDNDEKATATYSGADHPEVSRGP